MVNKKLVFSFLLICFASAAQAEGAWVADKNGCKLWDADPSKNESIVWAGDCSTGYVNGKGALQFYDGRVFLGRYQGDTYNGYVEGKGKFSTADGTTYDGEWIKSRQHGKGKLILASGAVFESEWVDGKNNQPGKLTEKNGETYEGTLHDDNKFTGRNIKGGGLIIGALLREDGKLDIYGGRTKEQAEQANKIKRQQEITQIESEVADEPKTNVGEEILKGINSGLEQNAQQQQKFDQLKRDAQAQQDAKNAQEIAEAKARRDQQQQHTQQQSTGSNSSGAGDMVCVSVSNNGTFNCPCHMECHPRVQ